MLTTLFRCHLNLVTNNADPETTTLVTRRDQNLHGNDSVSRVLFQVRFLLSGTSLVVKKVSVLVTIRNSGAINDGTNIFFYQRGPEALKWHTGLQINGPGLTSKANKLHFTKIRMGPVPVPVPRHVGIGWVLLGSNTGTKNSIISGSGPYISGLTSKANKLNFTKICLGPVPVLVPRRVRIGWVLFGSNTGTKNTIISGSGPNISGLTSKTNTQNFTKTRLGPVPVSVPRRVRIGWVLFVSNTGTKNSIISGSSPYKSGPTSKTNNQNFTKAWLGPVPKYERTCFGWYGSNTDSIFQIFICIRSLLYYLLPNYLCKSDDAATLCEQSGSVLGWFVADTGTNFLTFISFMKLLYYFLTKYLWSGSNTDTIFQIFFCFRKLLYYILRNNLSKADAAEILCEQSGPSLGWFGADTSPISLIFNSFMKLLNYFFMNYFLQNCRGSNIW